jgi:hypothetical protein
MGLRCSWRGGTLEQVEQRILMRVPGALRLRLMNLRWGGLPSLLDMVCNAAEEL